MAPCVELRAAIVAGVSGSLQALDPDGKMPAALKYRMALAQEAQRAEGFAWARLRHLRYVDVPGLRFIPTLGDVMRRKARRWGWARWIATPLLIFPVLIGRDVWVGLDPQWLKLVYTVPIMLVFGVGLVLFWGLGPDKRAKIGEARDGFYFTPNLLTERSVNDAGPDNIWMVPRDQILRFYRTNSGTEAGERVWVEYRRANGEVATRRTGLPGLGGPDRDWLERWRTTGALPIPPLADEDARINAG